MTVSQYLEKLNARYKSGISTEHSYRGDLQQLLESLLPDLQVTNEPTRIDCGAPDYILTKSSVPVGYIEAKDVGTDLKSKSLKEQFDRYKASLNNLIITDYLDFQLFIDGELQVSVRIGEIQGNRIVPVSGQFEAFEAMVRNFGTHIGQTIRSAKKLAEMMAGKAKMLAIVIENALEADEKRDSGGTYEEANNTLRDQLRAFKTILIHDITNREFADIYAQTIAYGMFAARLHDPDLETFSRSEAAERIPKSNPFLRKLFQYIAGYDLDDRIRWIVEALADIFRATDVRGLLKNFGRATAQQDPIIHFYETFLSKYDPKLRKARGVWYTPEPVVNFIVRAVDDLLKTEFDLPQGLADSSKIKIKVDVNGKKIDQEVHRVQILDPATGTGTFLAEVIRQVHNKFKGQEGIWSSYVENHLIPRLNGFELLMASYAMAHLQLELLLSETGYKPTMDQRLRVYLTNSLEEYHPDTGTIWTNMLSTEAEGANRIKKQTPVMVIIGNPPYSGISSNNGSWIQNLIDDYKYINGVHFKERKHWLNDDYVKFIRFGQYLVERTGHGILAYINPHGYIDNPTFRGMRWNILNAFDKLFVIDLHGNSNKKEISPDGSTDENVFDIQQGVSISIFVRTDRNAKSKEVGSIKHFEVHGSRETKYSFLAQNSLDKIQFKEVIAQDPHFFFKPNGGLQLDKYNSGFGLTDLFKVFVTGIVTARDSLVISESKSELIARIEYFADLTKSDSEIREHFFGAKKSGRYESGDSRGWKLKEARRKISAFRHESLIQRIAYRPFDIRYIYYDPSMVDWGRENVMSNFIQGQNVGLVVPKINKEENCFFISDTMIGHKLCSAYDSNSIFPLYIFPNNTGQGSIQVLEKVPNLNMHTVSKIADCLGMKFSVNVPENKETFSPEDLLHYIYGVFHSRKYRNEYREYLKVDFPRVPYPKEADTFWNLVELGGKLKNVHLLKPGFLLNNIPLFRHKGTNEVCSVKWIENNVHINSMQSFENVPFEVWNFYVGGYQPAQKWLKDRKGRILSYEDIVHYQNIIAALVETDKIMNKIDEIIE